MKKGVFMFYALINEYDEGSLWSIIKFSPERNVYLMFDSGRYGTGYNKILKTLEECKSCSLFLNTHEDEYERLRPVLFQIKTHNQWRKVKKLAINLYKENLLDTFMLIESDLNDVNDLQENLKPLLSATLKNGKSVFVRFYDPLVLLKLLYIWTQESQKRIWNHIVKWYVFDDKRRIAVKLKRKDEYCGNGIK